MGNRIKPTHGNVAIRLQKTYNRVEWGFLEGTMKAMGFNETWIKCIRALYINLWCSVGINGTTSSTLNYQDQWGKAVS